MTGAFWRSAFVAAVFAIHPLRVESVAWVAERKDVLSGLFFMLTIGAYVRYARRPWSPLRYALVVLLFALGLMCKPMLVTLPFVLLLLDYWPLNRFATVRDQRDNIFHIPRRLILEKLPLLALAAASGVVTLLAQKGSLQPFVGIPLPLRMGNAFISCAAYLRQMFWPVDLAVLYPFTDRDICGARNSVIRPVGRYFGRRFFPASPSLSRDRLALVSRHARAGDRDSSGGKSGAGGPLHLSSADRFVSAADMGGG